MLSTAKAKKVEDTTRVITLDGLKEALLWKLTNSDDFAKGVLEFANKKAEEGLDDSALLDAAFSIPQNNDVKHMTMSEFHEKYSTVEKAAVALKLDLQEWAPDAHKLLKVDMRVFDWLKFSLEIVDSTTNMGHESSHRMLVDPIVQGAAFVLKNIYLWSEHSLNARVTLKIGEREISGFVDYAASGVKTLGSQSIAELLKHGHAKPQLPYCVVVEVKKGTEVDKGFGQVLIEMKIVQAATGQKCVNGIFTNGNVYYFLRLEGSKLLATGALYRTSSLEEIFLLAQVALSGKSFWTKLPTPTQPAEQVTKLPDGSTQVVTVFPPGSTPPRVRSSSATSGDSSSSAILSRANSTEAKKSTKKPTTPSDQQPKLKTTSSTSSTSKKSPEGPTKAAQRASSAVPTPQEIPTTRKTRSMSAAAKSQVVSDAPPSPSRRSFVYPKVTYQPLVRAVAQPSPPPPAVSPIPAPDDVDPTLLLEISRSSIDDDLEVSCVTSQLGNPGAPPVSDADSSSYDERTPSPKRKSPSSSSSVASPARKRSNSQHQ